LQFILLAIVIDTARHNFIYPMTNNRRYYGSTEIKATSMPNSVFIKYNNLQDTEDTVSSCF